MHKRKDSASAAKSTRARECCENVKLSLFVENPDNPSVATDEDIARLAGKLKRVPLGLTAMRIAYVTDADGDERTRGKRMVISGNKRLRVLKQAYGEDGEVPAEWFADVTAMSEAERHEFIVSANVSDGEWDVDKLLAQYDKGELGELMKGEELEKLLDGIEDAEVEGETDADAVPEVPEEPKSKRGAVYQLGRHRVMCGDSTKAEDVARMMGGKRADMAFSSPPYGAAKSTAIRSHYVRGKKTAKSFYDEHEDNANEWLSLVSSVFANMAKNTDVQFVNLQMLADNKRDFVKFVADNSDSLIDIAIWDKQKAPPQMADNILNNQFEFVLIFGGDNRVIPHAHFHGNINNVISLPCGQNEYAEIHKAVFPVDFPCAFLDVCEDAKSVLDLFCGTGTTIIAAEKKNRVGYGMELSPQYVDVIRRRWAEFVHGEGCDWESLTPEITNAEDAD